MATQRITLAQLELPAQMPAGYRGGTWRDRRATARVIDEALRPAPRYRRPLAANCLADPRPRLTLATGGAR